MRSIFAAFAALAMFAAPAAAQDSRVFVNVNFGFQSQKQELKQTAEFPLYDETGTWETAHEIKGGPIFDIGAGVRVMRNLSVGLAFSTLTKQTRDVTVNATVPSPIFTDVLRPATGTVSGLEHSERAVHVQALWHVPVTVEFDVTLFAGPTFFTVKDALVESITPTEVGGDFSSVNLDSIAVSNQRESTVGFNVGLDARYMVTRNIGAGAMLRYTRGSVDLTAPAATGGSTFTLDTGGLEIGAGLRVRF